MTDYQSKAEARKEMSKYIRYYVHERGHSSLDYRSPAQFEQITKFAKQENDLSLKPVPPHEVPIGSQIALQDVGDGEFHVFLTGGQRLLNGDAHLLSSIGYRVPVDSGAQSTSIHWSNHLDYRITKKLYVFTEIAWWHFTDDAGVGLPGIAGQDLFNLTANGIEGQNLVTQGVGVRLKPSPKTEIGVAYEFPLSNFDDIISSRLMVDMIYRF